MDKAICFISISFLPLDQITKIKICHISLSKHTKMIEGMWRLIDMEFLNPEEAYEYGEVDDDKSDLDS